MMVRPFVLAIGIAAYAFPASAAAPAPNPEAGHQLVVKSCSSCHALNGSKSAVDGAPPLSFLAKDNKVRPAWVRGWLMDPHPPMPSIGLSRAQINNIIAYLNSLPTD